MAVARELARPASRISTSRALTPRSLPGLLLWLSSDHGASETLVAAQTTAANSEQLTAADHVSLSPTTSDYWISIWVYAQTLGANRSFVSKGTAVSGTGVEYALGYVHGGTQRYRFTHGDGVGGTLTTVNAGNFGVPATGAWHHVLAWKGATNIGIRVNGGTANTAAHSNRSPADTAGTFRIGCWNNIEFWDGRLALGAIGVAPPGGVDALVDTLTARLYNGGNPPSYAALSAQEKTDYGLAHWWALDEASDGSLAVTRTAAHGGRNLTDTNTCPSADGPTRTAVDGGTVSALADRSDDLNAAAQATVANRPTLAAGTFGTLPGLAFDGADDFLALSSDLVLDGDFTLTLAAKVASQPSAYFSHSSGTGKVVQTDGSTVTLTDDAGNALALAHPPLDGGAHALALVRSGTTVTRYLDGQPDGSGTLAGTITLDRVGASADSLDGDLADVIIYDRAYTP